MLRILFAGTPQLAMVIFQALVTANYNIVACLTQADKPAGRGQKLTASPVKQYALQQHIPVYQPETLKTQDIQKLITNLQPDIAVVVAYGLIIPQSLLTIPKYGFINIHLSLLPSWRGASPIQHAILAGEQTTGVSIMQMDDKLDTGDMLAMASLPITTTDTSDSLQNKLCTLGITEVIKILRKIPTSTLQPIKQDNTKATYAHKISKQDARINWQQPAQRIALQIRAYNSWPVAFTYSKEIPIRVWEAATTSTTIHNSIPGSILTVSKQGIEVATGEGVISLHKIQLPNKKPLLVAEIIKANNHPFIPGNILL